MKAEASHWLWKQLCCVGVYFAQDGCSHDALADRYRRHLDVNPGIHVFLIVGEGGAARPCWPLMVLVHIMCHCVRYGGLVARRTFSRVLEVLRYGSIYRPTITFGLSEFTLPATK